MTEDAKSAASKKIADWRSCPDSGTSGTPMVGVPDDFRKYQSQCDRRAEHFKTPANGSATVRKYMWKCFGLSALDFREHHCKWSCLDSRDRVTMRFSVFLLGLAVSMAFVWHFVIADLIASDLPVDNTTKSESEKGQIFDVRAYGAKGDGITDDTGAFASVVSAATAASGTVQIPAGTYIATINVTKGGITIQGAGEDTTVIKAPSATAATRLVTVANSDGTTIRDLTIDGNKVERSGQKPMTYGLLLYQSSDCVIENVRVINAEVIGIGVSASKRTRIFKCDVDGSGWQNITTLNNKAGGCEGSVISQCRSTSPGYDCIQVSNVGSVTVENCYLSGSPFAGIYVATGARNVTLRNNTISRCYCGIDMSWGAAGGANTGPDASEGNVIIGNRVTRCQAGGIGTGSNGTVITKNTVLDTGVGAFPTYTLLGQRTAISSAGRGYRIGDVLTFVGGRYIKPAQVQVTGVGPGGEVTSTNIYYLGVYTVTPANLISVKGGHGTGATVNTTWNARGFQCAGIGVIDAANVTITNNISSNSAGNTAQRYGVALFRLHTGPSHLTISGNALSGNAVSSVSPVMRGGGRAP